VVLLVGAGLLRKQTLKSARAADWLSRTSTSCCGGDVRGAVKVSSAERSALRQQDEEAARGGDPGVKKISAQR